MKKASLSISLEQVILLIVVAMLIPVILTVTNNVAGLFYSKSDQSTVNNFNNLAESIEELSNSAVGKEKPIELTEDGKYQIHQSEKNNNIAYVDVYFYMKEGYSLVGYNKIESISEDSTRPKECGIKACICLFSDENLKNLEKCSSFDKISKILPGDVTFVNTANVNVENIENVYVIKNRGGTSSLNWYAKSDTGVIGVELIRDSTGEAAGYYKMTLTNAEKVTK